MLTIVDQCLGLSVKLCEISINLPSFPTPLSPAKKSLASFFKVGLVKLPSRSNAFHHDTQLP